MKGIAPLLIALILIIGAIGVFTIATPGLGASLAAIISGPKLCSETPYDANCICPEGQEQLLTASSLLPRYFCEKIIKFLDPADPQWVIKAQAYASTKLTELFPTCDMAQCNTHGATWRSASGYTYPADGSAVFRTFGLDCQNDQMFRFAEFQFDAENGAVLDASCGSYDQVVQQTISTESARLEPEFSSDRIRDANPIVSVSFVMDSQCLDKDNGIGISTWNAPRGHIAQWQVADGSQYCTISGSSPEYVTLKCDSICPHAGFGGWHIGVVGQYDSSYVNSLGCTIGTQRWLPGEFVVCNGYKFTCEDNQGWLRRMDGTSTTGTQFCPPTYHAMCKAGGYAGPSGWVSTQWLMPDQIGPDGRTCQNDGTWA